MFRIEPGPEIRAIMKRSEKMMDPVWSKESGIHTEMFNGDPIEVNNALNAFYDTLRTSGRGHEIISTTTNTIPYGIVAYVTYRLD